VNRLLPVVLAVFSALYASRVVNASELGDRYDRAEEWIPRWGPLVAAVLTIAAIWWTWGFLHPQPTTFDGTSYLLQAQIFSGLHWTAPSPPLPEFFEQPQVLVVPVVASKFLPGHALVLAIGALLRFPPLVPLLVAGCTAALLVAVVARIANPWIAIVTWIAWLTTPVVLRFQPSYSAETTATLAIVAGWWCTIEWRERKKWYWAAAAGAAFAWCGITDAVMAAAFGILPAAFIVVKAIRRARWSSVGALVVAAALVLAIIPLWSVQTTGRASVTPTAEYRQDYFPFARPGFSISSEAPRRPLTPVLEGLRDDLLARQEAQQPNRIGRTVTDRLVALVRDLWRAPQLVMLPFFIVGLFVMNRAMQLGLVSSLLLILGRIPFPQDPESTLPYLPVALVVAAITACGVWRVLLWVAKAVIVRLHVERRPKLGSALVALVLAFFAVPTLSGWRTRHLQDATERTAFDDAVAQLPSSKSIIFVTYTPQRRQHFGFVRNHPDLQKAPIWVVHDLGNRNRELTAMAQDRTAYIFDERTMEFRRY
jgi:hypothetical protein